ncbi:Glycerol kinase [hydrothermal vent metagenome]|uniref:glycerol kinase n=1 Tax=hydrothermal vent metagenome TaxID=652676 RepID=A0A3B0TRC9_9ZZZZ
MNDFILAIDQGTTSSRAILFDGKQNVVGVSQKEFTQIFPKSGWVEHDPEEIWQSVVTTCRQAINNAKISARQIAAIGISNQRETVVVWDRETGKPVYNAIVWQDRRTAKMCETLKLAAKEKIFTKKTGLLLDPYFSGTKLRWLMENVPGIKEKARKGKLAFGTIDSFLIWRLTGGEVHATDATNASRTLMFNIKTNEWDEELLKILKVDAELLPQVKDCADNYGVTKPDLFGAAIAIRGVAGDQHAATIGQACFKPGMIKATFGTGCFVVLNTGDRLVSSKNRLLSTIAYRLDGKTTYALEGSIFVAGAAVQWLRDGLKIIKDAAETGDMAAMADPNQSVYMVPAFVGMGAPYWDAEARGAIFGITRNTGPKELARAALEAVCYQTKDLIEAMHKDWKGSGSETILRVDGGMVASDWTMQFLADILDAPVDRPTISETSALGAAWLAGAHVGVWPNQRNFTKSWALEHQFTPQIKRRQRNIKLKGWQNAVERTLSKRN